MIDKSKGYIVMYGEYAFELYRFRQDLGYYQPDENEYSVSRLVRKIKNDRPAFVQLEGLDKNVQNLIRGGLADGVRYGTNGRNRDLLEEVKRKGRIW